MRLGQFLIIRNAIKRLDKSVEKSVVPEGVGILRHVSYIFCYVCVKYVCAGANSVIQALSTMFCFSFKILIKNVFLRQDLSMSP